MGNYQKRIKRWKKKKAKFQSFSVQILWRLIFSQSLTADACEHPNNPPISSSNKRNCVLQRENTKEMVRKTHFQLNASFQKTQNFGRNLSFTSYCVVCWLSRTLVGSTETVCVLCSFRLLFFQNWNFSWILKCSVATSVQRLRIERSSIGWRRVNLKFEKPVKSVIDENVF